MKTLLGTSPARDLRFKIGDTIRNKISQENGRIVRVADLLSCGRCYIVEVTLNQTIWRTPTMEALWHTSDVEQAPIRP